MRYKGLMFLQLALLATVLSLGLSGCMVRRAGESRPVVWVDEQLPGPMHQYEYYPNQMVYYDRGPAQYYWQEKGSWRSGRRLPSHIKLDRRRRVRFDSDSDRPYAVHNRVVEDYTSRERTRIRQQESYRQRHGN